jgi:hypothetical protein
MEAFEPGSGEAGLGIRAPSWGRGCTKQVHLCHRAGVILHSTPSTDRHTAHSTPYPMLSTNTDFTIIRPTDIPHASQIYTHTSTHLHVTHTPVTHNGPIHPHTPRAHPQSPMVHFTHKREHPCTHSTNIHCAMHSPCRKVTIRHTDDRGPGCLSDRDRASGAE